MTPLTDHELGSLLTETFTAHEHLADPGRAAELAAAPGRPRHPGRVLLSAAAAVALVAGGTAYVVSQGGDGPGPVAGPSTPTSTAGDHQPPLPPLQTDAGNRAAAEHTTRQIAATLPVYPGAEEVDAAAVPGLRGVSSPLVSEDTVVESHFWIVSGVIRDAVPQWYAEHAPPGLHTRGGRNGVGSEGIGRTLVNELTWVSPQGDRLPPDRSWVDVYTINTTSGVAIRASIYTPWRPARPVESYVQDVGSIDVHVVETRLNPTLHQRERSFTVTAPAAVLRVANTFNHLPGAAPEPAHSCPAITAFYTDRVVFHTATGDVVAVDKGSICGSEIRVVRDGRTIGPGLDDAGRLLLALGVHHFVRG